DARFARLMEAADALAGSARPDEAAATLARLREAALADEAGKALDAELARVLAAGRQPSATPPSEARRTTA
ncbi:MAG TPA: hypothetical protein PL143_14390, partial [Rhodocyclaceae bacterium]|nr:hypothetical protein [Rhodocyclaceae bacterium]